MKTSLIHLVLGTVNGRCFLGTSTTYCAKNQMKKWFFSFLGWRLPVWKVKLWKIFGR